MAKVAVQKTKKYGKIKAFSFALRHRTSFSIKDGNQKSGGRLACGTA